MFIGFISFGAALLFLNFIIRVLSKGLFVQNIDDPVTKHGDDNIPLSNTTYNSKSVDEPDNQRWRSIDMLDPVNNHGSNSNMASRPSSETLR